MFVLASSMRGTNSCWCVLGTDIGQNLHCFVVPNRMYIIHQNVLMVNDYFMPFMIFFFLNLRLKHIFLDFLMKFFDVGWILDVSSDIS